MTQPQPFTEDLITASNSPEWLTAKRRESLALFNGLDLPTETVEAWKYTHVSDIDFGKLHPHAKREVVTDVTQLPSSVQKRLNGTDVGVLPGLDGLGGQLQAIEQGQ